MLAISPALARDGDRPFLLAFTHDVASTAGIGSLENSLVPEGSSEIRVWIGFGVVVPDHLLRLVIDRDGEVEGNVFRHFPSDTSYMQEYEAEFHRELMTGCTDLRRGKESAVCTATFRDQPDWLALYGNLVDLDILTLPDESELPKPQHRVKDGIAMVVEIRSGSDYRAYGYSNPSVRTEPQAQSASHIIRMINSLVSQAGGT
jgi:hypothetical protein